MSRFIVFDVALESNAVSLILVHTHMYMHIRVREYSDDSYRVFDIVLESNAVSLILVHTHTYMHICMYICSRSLTYIVTRTHICICTFAPLLAKGDVT